MGWFRRFKSRFNYTHRKKTTVVSIKRTKKEDVEFGQRGEGQTAPFHKEAIDVARMKVFSQQVQKLCREKSYNPSRIINVDETPVWLDMLPASTLEKKGARNVIVAESVAGASRYRRVTCFPVISAAGDKLFLGIVAHSVQKGTIHRQYRPDVHIWKQSPSSMTSELLCSFITDILDPALPGNDPKLLILDRSSTHTTKAVRKKCEDRGIDVLFVPANCTKYLQPLDLTVNRSFKAASGRNYVDQFQTERSLAERMSVLSRKQLKLGTLSTKMSLYEDLVRCVDFWVLLAAP